MRGKPKKSILHDYMRDSYEEFARVLCEEIRRKNPKSRRLLEQIEDAMKDIMKDHFGEDRPGDASID